MSLLYVHLRIWPTYPIINYTKLIVNKIISPYREKKIIENNSNINKCFNLNKNKEKIIYKTLVIGHAYGRSEETNKGLYPKLLDYLKKEKIFYDLIILNGDIVRNPSTENYKFAIDQISNFSKKIFIVPGNHDVGINLDNERRKIYEDFFKDKKNYFLLNKNLFFSLDTNYGISILKKDFDQLKKLLKNNEISNLFIFSHHIPWRNFMNNKIIIPKPKKESVILRNDKKNLINTNLFIKFLNTLKINKYLISGGSTNDWFIYCEKQPKNQMSIISSGVGENKTNSLLTIDFSSKDHYMGYKLFK